MNCLHYIDFIYICTLYFIENSIRTFTVSAVQLLQGKHFIKTHRDYEGKDIETAWLL